MTLPSLDIDGQNRPSVLVTCRLSAFAKPQMLLAPDVQAMATPVVRQRIGDGADRSSPPRRQ
jgi:hypothetical protein